MDYSLPGSSVHGDAPGKNIGVGHHALLQGIFPTQVSCIAGRFFTIWAPREALSNQEKQESLRKQERMQETEENIETLMNILCKIGDSTAFFLFSKEKNRMLQEEARENVKFLAIKNMRDKT